MTLSVLTGCGEVGVIARSTKENSPQAEISSLGAAADTSAAHDIEPQVVSFCGNCHAAPNPQSFTSKDWPREVQRGFDFYFASGRSDLRVPKRELVKNYYQLLAPSGAELPEPAPLDVAANERFDWISLPDKSSGNPFFAGSSICSVDLQQFGGRGLLISDMYGGDLMWLSLADNPAVGLGDRKLEPIARLKNPSRMLRGDFDGDGSGDLLVADLGSFLPADHQSGRVVWLRPETSQDTEIPFSCQQSVILRGCGRVADVSAGDLDADGDLDLVVADFRWHETGRILWLERIAPEMSASSFKVHEVDSRPGTLQVPVVDIDGDGDLDFIALIAQEFEMVVAYINEGHGEFVAKTLFDMGDPASGSSGMDLVDLDADGDLDIIHTNGDSFDSFHLKSYHGVRWLENQGDLKFAAHSIALMPGIHRASPSDLDSDGDVDLVAVAFLPETLMKGQTSGSPEAIVWFDNDGFQNFTRRPLKVGQAIHPAVLVEDLNRDGRVDIAVTAFGDSAANDSLALELAIAKDTAKDVVPN